MNIIITTMNIIITTFLSQSNHYSTTQLL